MKKKWFFVTAGVILVTAISGIIVWNQMNRNQKPDVTEMTEAEKMDMEDYMVATECMLSGNYSDAIVNLLQISDDSVLKGAATIELAKCRIALGDSTTAANELQSILNTNEPDYHRWFSMNTKQFAADDMMNYLADVDSFTSREGLTEAYLLLARCYELKGEYENAIKTIKRAMIFFTDPLLNHALERYTNEYSNQGVMSYYDYYTKNIGKEDLHAVMMEQIPVEEVTELDTEISEGVPFSEIQADTQVLEQIVQAMKSKDYQTVYELALGGGLSGAAGCENGFYYVPSSGEISEGIKDGEGIFIQSFTGEYYRIAYANWKNGVKTGLCYATEGGFNLWFAIECNVSGNQFDGDYIYYAHDSYGEGWTNTAKGTMTANSASGPTEYYWDYDEDAGIATVTLYDGSYVAGKNDLYDEMQNVYWVTTDSGIGIPLEKATKLVKNSQEIGWMIQEEHNIFADGTNTAESGLYKNKVNLPLWTLEDQRDRNSYKDDKLMLYLCSMSESLRVDEEGVIRWHCYLPDEKIEDFKITVSDKSILKVDPTIEVSPDTSYICKIYGQGDTGGRVTITVSMPEYGLSVKKTITILTPFQVDSGNGEMETVYAYIDEELSEELFYYTNLYRREYGVSVLKKMSQTEDNFANTRNLESIWKLDYLSNRMPSVTIHDGTPEFEKYQNEIEQEYERIANLSNEDRIADKAEKCKWYHERPNGETYNARENLQMSGLMWARSEMAYKLVYQGWGNSEGHKVTMIYPGYHNLSTSVAITEKGNYYAVQHFY